MKKVLSLVTGLFFAVVLFAQQTINDQNATVRDVKGFHGVRVSTGIKLILTQGTTETVAVSADKPEERERIRTVVENGILKIYYDYEKWKLWGIDHRRKCRAYVSIVSVNQLAATSGANIKVEGVLKTNNLNIHASSGGNIEGNVEVAELEVDQNSGSLIHISGSAGRLSVDGSSGSRFQGFDLVTDHCAVGTSSGGNVQITVNKELTARASSGGQVHYKGEGAIRNIHTSSGGNVSRTN